MTGALIHYSRKGSAARAATFKQASRRSRFCQSETFPQPYQFVIEPSGRKYVCARFVSYFVTSRIGVSLLIRSEEHTSELQSHSDLVCRLLLEKKNNKQHNIL